jgi:preprotein translocase subunit SecE
LSVMQNLVWIIVWVAIIGGAFAWLWYKGHLQRFADYVKATREELRKCTWPSWEELKGSTVVITISIVILGGFTVLVDQILFRVFMFLKL